MIMVTGATGTIGTELIGQLVKEGRKVRARPTCRARRSWSKPTS